ncbi:T9SS type A sorting domain-containing protein [Flavobacterium sp.]|uniref:T9SS type A sorting domain-containing protein n=1 Tax=Flavobacterium sp. TaxID=239 RepID=UPI0025C49171|nr:T9SS type A sorting domain-containing protein [Flavobacterium sp.]
MRKIYFLLLCTVASYSQTQIGTDIDGEAADDISGYSVSLSSDGNVLAIGGIYNDGNGTSSGHVRVYSNNSGVWTQIGADIDGEAANDASGYSVSLSSDGNIVAIGSYANDGDNGNFPNTGHVRVFQNLAGVWTQIGSDIDGEFISDLSGCSVSLSDDGSIIAIGALSNDANGSASGNVRVFKNISNVWTQIGNSINGEAALDFSGASISLSNDGSILAIGAYNNDGVNGTDSGHVRVYQNIANNWIQQGSDIDGEAANNFSGYSVSLSGDGSTVAIGAYYNGGATNSPGSGHVRVYKNLSNVWTQVGLDIYGEGNGDYFGHSVSLSNDGNVLVVGAPLNDGNGSNAGLVRVYQNISGAWTHIGLDMDGEGVDDNFGISLSLSGDGSTVAIGATNNDANGSDSGHVRVFDISPVLSSDGFVLSKFLIYPNPVSELVTISLQNDLELKSINIYNSLGQFIKSEKNSSIDVRQLSKGTYFFEVITNKGKATKAIIVE